MKIISLIVLLGLSASCAMDVVTEFDRCVRDRLSEGNTLDEAEMVCNIIPIGEVDFD